MIPDIFLGIFTNLINFLCKILPTWNLPNGVYSATITLYKIVLGLNSFLPVLLAFQMFGVVLFFELTIISIKAIFSLFSLLRGGGDLKI